MALLGWLLGMQNARGPMALLLATNGVNIVLDLWFVFGLGWGVAGVAAATVAASTAAPGSASGSPRGADRAARRLELAARSRAAPPFARLLAVSRDILLRSLSLEAAFLTFTALSARQSDWCSPPAPACCSTS